MNLKFKVPTFEYMIGSILELQNEDNGDFFKESLFYFYPSLDKEKFNSIQGQEKKEYLIEVMQIVYDENLLLMKEKVNYYNEYWTENKKVIIETFQEVFHMNLEDEFNNMVGNIALNPVCPRYLNTNSFDIFYLNSEKGALGIALHEIIHFIWFKIWNKHFKDEWNEYETPHLKWVFSEMIPDIIMRDERLKERNPYFNNGCVYEYFYKIVIDDKPILDTLYEMFQNMPVTEFMEKGYEYCQLNESIIRSVM